MRTSALFLVFAIILLMFVMLYSIYFYSKEGFALARHFGDGAGSRHRCEAKGCTNTDGEEGEFYEEKDCQTHCVSFVNKNGKCTKVKGSPWNGYATKTACEKGTYDSFI